MNSIYITAAQARIAELSTLLEIHNYNYYQLSGSTISVVPISDYAFDTLLNELIQLEQQYPQLQLPTSPTQRVGGSITKSFNTVKHQYPMLSLSNTYTIEDLLAFDERIKKGLLTDEYEYVCELKYDGVAIGIKYKNGVLQQAVTRGDGTQGDDVTNNVKTIKTIPLHLTQGTYPNEFEIRGEIFMPHQVFTQLNAAREAIGDALMANPRNAASGSLKMQDSAQVAQRKLDCFLYFLYTPDSNYATHEQSLQAANSWGFKVGNYYKKCTTINDVIAYINHWDSARFNLPFDIDGIVIKINSVAQQKTLGFTSKNPRWATSYKFKPQQVATQLLNVSYQVGRTGNVTPVANLEPVLVSGSTVRRATLHNSDFMTELDLRFNDYVYVEKGGEIIPKIMGVDLSRRATDAKPFIFIHRCPECGSTLVRVEGEANHYCMNEDICAPQIKGKMIHFVGRKMMNIDGLGEESIETLFEQKLLHNYADIYELKAEQLLAIERFGQKTVDNLLAGIEASKQVPFERVLFALGIRHVGENTAKKLAHYFHNLIKFKAATLEELTQVGEVGDKIAVSIRAYFNNEAQQTILKRLVNAGLQFALHEDTLVTKTNKLAGKTLVVSGVFTVERDTIKQLIEQNGGKLSGSISGKTSYVVAGDNMGPEKLKKAESLGVAIISEQQLMELIA
ncbi:MAG: NAD-dependent DNA ligase LigA [Bacteroidia bacterium]|nr:NAD-dependent DNA ligase LigA [Bacteroidia bacterium]